MRPELKLVGDAVGQQDLLEGVVKDPVLEVFEFWKVMMMKERSQLGFARREKITRALKIGYTVDDLRLAIVGCKFDAWSQGENKSQMRYNDIELICRDEVRIDRFIEFGQEYMRRAQRKEKEARERDTSDAVPMPDYIKQKLEDLFKKGREHK